VESYSFVTVWRLPFPPGRVWDELNRPERYAEWWPNIVEYESLTPGQTGVGCRARRAVRGALPYTLRYSTVITAMVPPREVAYDAEGDLNGWGRFVVEPDGQGTIVTFDWHVSTTGHAMNLLAPLLKPVFAWNHNWVMERGRRGLAEHLAANERGAPSQPPAEPAAEARGPS
jgi:carbon monoxide dehydrogenase subunit G